jgi:hypothetical protein
MNRHLDPTPSETVAMTAAVATSQLVSTDHAPIQRTARVMALLILASAVFGGLGESYIPSKLIVSGDAAATVNNIASSPMLFRLGFATYLVEAVCDVALAVLFYELLRPAGQQLALFAAFLGLLSTALYAVAEACYFAPSVILSGADHLKSFSPDQLNSLSLLSFKLFNMIAGLFLCLYGLATVVRGYLMYRSGYLPRTIGVLFVIGGASFIADSLAVVLAPRFVSAFLLMPIGVAGISLMLWLFVKGVDAERWRASS